MQTHSFLITSLRTILKILADDEITNIPREISYIFLFVMFSQRLTLFYKSWGIFNIAYTDEKIIYFTQIANWSTVSQLLNILKSDTFNLIAMYFWYVLHFSSFLLQFIIVFFRNYLSKTTIYSLSRIIYTYFTIFQYIILFPSILFTSRIVICDRQSFIVGSSNNCGIISYIVNGTMLYALLLYQCCVYAYLCRNITLPITNYLKRRQSPLTLIAMILEFPCLFLQQFMQSEIYIVNNILKIVLMLVYVVDSIRFRPLHSRLNVFFLRCSSILLFNSILFFVDDLIKIDEDALLYASFIISPLIAHMSAIIFESSKSNKREEEILYWIDELHVMESELKKDNSYQIKWLCVIKTHQSICSNIRCSSHNKLNIANLQKVKEVTNSVVICAINQYIRQEEQKILKDRKSLEGIYLQLITYLSNECFTPLKGYIQLKTFEAKQLSTSTFFQIMSEYFNDKLEFKTKQFQDLKYQTTVKDNDFEKLDIKEIRGTEALWVSLYPKIVKVVDQKIIFWQRLITGYPRIEDFLEQAVKLSQIIWDVKKSIFTKIEVDPLNINKSLQHLNGVQLKILSIVYSAVLNDYYGTMDIEARLDEILQFERNLYWDIILNTTLLNETVVIIQISVIKNKGLILNKNRSTLARFFGYDSLMDFNAIQLVQDLMPEFIKSKHDNLIENYISRGYSKFFSASQIVFGQNKQGFIQCLHLRLANLFDIQKDYIINGSLLKIKMNYNFLLFDQNGRILGLTQEVYEFFVSEQEKGLLSPDFIYKKCFIFFWITQICEGIREDFKDLIRQDTEHMSQVRTIVLTPPKKLQQQSKDFERFCQSNQLKDTFFSHNEAHNLRKASSRVESAVNSSLHSQKNLELNDVQQLEEDDTELYSIEQNKIFGYKIPLISTKISKQLDLFQTQYQQNQKQTTMMTGQETQYPQQNSMAFKYALQVATIGEGENGSCYFICHIHELRKQDQNATNLKLTLNTQTNNSINSELHQTKDNLNDETFENKMVIDLSQVIDDQSQHSKKKQFQLNPNVITFQQLNIDDQLNLSDVSQILNENVIHPIVNAQESYVNAQESYYKDISQLVSPRKNPEEHLIQQEIIEIEQEEEEEQVNQESSLKDGKKPSRNMVAVFQENRLNNKQLQQGAAHQSTTSATSDKTQNSIFNLLKVLQYKNTLPTSLAQIFLTNAAICLLLLILIIIKVVLVKDNLSTLQTQLVLVRAPNQFNQMYCHFSIYTQLEFLDLFNITDFNKYELMRLETSSAISRKMLTPVIASVKNQFAIYQARNQLQVLQVRRILGNNIAQNSATFFEFIFYFNQEAFQINKLIQTNSTQYSYRQLLSTYTIKLNIFEELKLTQNLLDTVYASFYVSLYTNDNLYVVLLCVGLAMFAILIPIQVPFWKIHFLYKQRILLLISRTQQKDADVTLEKLQQTKNFLVDDNNKWKQMNYHQFYFLDGYDSKKHTKVKISSKKQTQAANRDSRSTLTSRIQEPRFSYFRIYMSVFLQVLIIWISLLAMYFYQSTVSQATRPQLSLSMSFIRFKQDYDNLNMLAFMIKTEPLIEEAVRQSQVLKDLIGFNETLNQQEIELTTKFSTVYQSVYQQFELIYDQIAQSQKIDAASKTQLLSLYENDLCIYLANLLPFCEFDGRKFAQFPSYPQPAPQDNYRSYLIYGMTGLVEALRQTVSSNYNQELHNNSYDRNFTRIQSYMRGKDFLSLIQSYFIDLYQPFTQFETSISSSALLMLDQDFTNITIFHVVMCSFLIVAAQILIVLQLKNGLLKVKAARQALVNMPFVMLLDPQTISQLKRLDQD